MEPDYTQLLTPRRLRRILIFTVIVVLSLFTLYWLYSHAYVEVTLANSASGDVSYSLTNQKTQKTTTFTSAASTINKLIPKGSYELLAQQNQTSYYSVIQAHGFLRKTSIQAHLQSEHIRRFVGNNPGNCMYYVNQILSSSNCGDSFASLNVHVPATQNQPTLVQKNQSNIDGNVEGIIKTNEGSLVLLQQVGGGVHTIYNLKNNLILGNGHALSELDTNKSYSVHNYKTGFVVYDSSSEQFLYYTSTSAKPTTITINGSLDKSFEPYAMSVDDSSIAVAYTNIPDTTEGPKVKKSKTEIVVYDGTNTRQFSFNKQYGSVSSCGQNRLCLLANKQLEVYDIAGDKQVPKFSLSSVEAIENSTKGLLVVKEKGVLQLNATNGDGFMSYSFGDYAFCGIQVDPDAQAYTLCLTNNKQKKVALHIDQNIDNIDNIDKKIAELLKSSDISDVSIYDKYIFISPQLGDLVFDESLQSFDYDPGVKKTVNAAIGQQITTLGIDKTKYQIINTSE